MQRNRKYRYSPAAIGLIAIAAIPWLGEERARGQEPVEWCDTYEHWAAKVGYQGGVAGAPCPTSGTCDTPSVRDSWIPGPTSPLVTIRIKFHVLCETDGSNCAAEIPADVAAQMAQLNSDFAAYRIQFMQGAEAEYINDSTYRLLWNDAQVDEMKDTYAEDPAHQVNVFVADLAGVLQGQGTFPWDPDALGNRGGIIMDELAFGADMHVLTHELGHNLGLWHTHHGVSEFFGQPCVGDGDPCDCPCYERANGVDGDITGDFASDTPPTPVNYFCSGPPGDDSCSVPPTPWAPTQPENYMSYGGDNCWTLFTAQQAGRKHCWLHDVLEGWFTCTTDEECDDVNECTDDDCVGEVCEYALVADYTVCTGGVCCNGTCTAAFVCSSDGDCDDSNECTADSCSNPDTCSASCEHIWPACDPNTPDGCCGPACTQDTDADCPCPGGGCCLNGVCNAGESPCDCTDCTEAATEQPGVTCQDGIDNDCDGYTDCDDVDCAPETGRDPACFCTDNGGTSPLVCVYWGDPNVDPVPDVDFFVDFVIDPSSPDVMFATGNNGWRVWSQVSRTDPTPANLGAVGINPVLPTENFSVTIAHRGRFAEYDVAGANNVGSVSLIDEGWTGHSNLADGRIAGSLLGDFVLQKNLGGQGGIGSLTVGGDASGNITIPGGGTLQVGGGVFANITIPSAATVQVGGAVSSASLITLGPLSFAEFNTATGDFSGQLVLPNGIPVNGAVNIYGRLTSSGLVDVSGQELAGILYLAHGSEALSVIDVGLLTGALGLYGYVPALSEYGGTITIGSVEPSGSISIVGVNLTGSISVAGDYKGFLGLGQSNFAPGASISIAGNVADSAFLLFDAEGQGVMGGDLHIGQDLDGFLEVHDWSGMIDVAGNVTGSVYAQSGLSGIVTVWGAHDGSFDVIGNVSGELRLHGGGGGTVNGTGISDFGRVVLSEGGAPYSGVATFNSVGPDGEIAIFGADLAGTIIATTVSGLVHLVGPPNGVVLPGATIQVVDNLSGPIKVQAMQGTVEIGGQIEDTGGVFVTSNLSGTINVLETHDGTIGVDNVEQGGSILIDGNSSGSISVLGTHEGAIDVGGDVLGSIDVLNDVLGTIMVAGDLAGDLHAGRHIEGVVDIGGGATGEILANADAFLDGDISGDVTVHGIFDGNICGDNLDPADVLPPSINLTFGPVGTVCGAPPCLGADAPTVATGEYAYIKNRYLTFVPQNGGQQTALRVTLVSTTLGPSFAALVGESWWVGAAVKQICENSGQIKPPCTPNVTFFASTLSCSPTYADWDGILSGQALHVSGQAVLPGSTYEISAIYQGCDIENEANYSMPLSISTAKWGDIVSTNATTPPGPPNGIVDSSDITAVQDKFYNHANAVIKSRADIDPETVNRLIDVSDITRVLDAFSSDPYPFAPPTACGG